MKLTKKLLKNMIRQQLRESKKFTPTAGGYLKSGMGSGSSIAGKETLALGLAALVISAVGPYAAIDFYKSSQLDKEEMAQVISEMSVEEVKDILQDFDYVDYGKASQRMDYKTSRLDKLGAPYDLKANPGGSRKRKQVLTIPVDEFAMEISQMQPEQIESLFEIREFKDAVIEFSMEMKDMESPEQQLKIQKDTGSVYRESYKKKK